MDARTFLSIDGAEIINSLRTLTYLRRGLGSPAIAVGLASPLTPEIGYRDDYVDTYEADPFWAGNLRCFCSPLDTGPYVSPAVDGAPWYDVTHAESGDFLGIEGALTVAEVPSRAVTTTSAGGGSIGQLRLKPRLVQFTGKMYAASEAGMSWGERWLTQVLAGPAIGCGESTARLLPSCPPEGADPLDYFRELAGVGLVDVPTFVPIQDVGACVAQTVSFQLAAGRPQLRTVPTDLLGWTPLRTVPTPSALLLGPAMVGDTTARITIAAGQTGSSVTGIVVTATQDAACPSALDADITYPIGRIPRHAELVIDSSVRQVTLRDTISGDVLGGPDLITFAGLFEWIEAAPGESWCIAVDASAATVNAGTLARIEAIGREL